MKYDMILRNIGLIYFWLESFFEMKYDMILAQAIEEHGELESFFEMKYDMIWRYWRWCLT